MWLAVRILPMGFFILDKEGMPGVENPMDRDLSFLVGCAIVGPLRRCTMCLSAWLLLSFFWAFWIFAFAGFWCGGPC